MPSSVASIFTAANCPPPDVVRWGETVPVSAPGAYVVALTSNPASLDAASPAAPIVEDAVRELLDCRPELLLDGIRPTVEELTERLRSFWLPDEVILYVGMAGKSLRERVRQYYATELGAARPHAGGWFLKTLGVLEHVYVHFVPCSDPAGVEHRMLASFSAAVSERARGRLHDPDRPIPFANIEWPRGRHKRHGIEGAKESRRGARTSVQVSRVAGGRSSGRERVASSATDAVCRTQRVTDVDIRAGRIRIPVGSTKDLFPRERAEITMDLRGERFTCRWDPRVGGDRRRSGVISIGRRRAARLLRPEDVLRVSKDGDAISLA